MSSAAHKKCIATDVNYFSDTFENNENEKRNQARHEGLLMKMNFRRWGEGDCAGVGCF
jgi:hypothetical protein